jgi:hypothetical protein
MSRFCDTHKLFKLTNLCILLNGLWPGAYDGVKAKAASDPPLSPLGRGGPPEQSTMCVDRLSWIDRRASFPGGNAVAQLPPAQGRPMFVRRDYSDKSPARQARRRNTVVHSRTSQPQPKQARRSINALANVRAPFAPPEDWHEATDRDGYRVVVQSPGIGHRHIVTPDQVRDRLLQVPASFIDQLEVVQLSCMTRKKQSFPCYGMQWGNAIYLYPLEESLIENFYEPPRPSLVNEAKMYGGRWEEPETGVWSLVWSEQAAQDFYLNNILIHELGHLVDERNTSYMERERYAEWFAVEYGYRATGGAGARRPTHPVCRRHHVK